MHRDRQHQASFKSARGHARTEWGRSGDDPHQTETREHARLPESMHRIRGSREAQAGREIRELRARY